MSAAQMMMELHKARGLDNEDPNRPHGRVNAMHAERPDLAALTSDTSNLLGNHFAAHSEDWI